MKRKKLERRIKLLEKRLHLMSPQNQRPETSIEYLHAKISSLGSRFDAVFKRLHALEHAERKRIAKTFADHEWAIKTWARKVDDMESKLKSAEHQIENILKRLHALEHADLLAPTTEKT